MNIKRNKLLSFYLKSSHFKNIFKQLIQIKHQLYYSIQSFLNINLQNFQNNCTLIGKNLFQNIISHQLFIFSTTKAKEEQEIEEIGNKVTKKFISEQSSKGKDASNAKTKCEKEPVKMSIKDLTNLKQKQEKIMMNIENENIQNHVNQMIEKFDPPECSTCLKRRADRVCINKKCGINKFMKLICGKCHLNEHQDQIVKPEIDIQEFFVKLATFLNQQKYETKQKLITNIDTEKLGLAIDEIGQLRQKLKSLRSQLENEIESYQSASEMHGSLQNSITKALSLCEYDNIQEQIGQIKKAVIFDNNKFSWNDCNEKWKIFSKQILQLDDNTNVFGQKIQKSMTGSGWQVDLTEVKILKSSILYGAQTYDKNKIIDNEIHFFNESQDMQFFLDYKLNQKNKYKLRFRFDCQPTSFVSFGILPESQAQSQWVYNIANEHFCKLFNSPNPQLDCSRILKGKDIRDFYQKDNQIEMRIDFEKDYMDIYDYPNVDNINANQSSDKYRKKEDYVIVIALNGVQHIVLESIEQIFYLDDLI